MKRKKAKRRTAAPSLGAAIFGGILLSVIIIFIWALIGGVLIGKERVSEAGFLNLVPVFLLVASLIGNRAATAHAEKQILLICGCTTLGLFLTLLAIPALFFDGEYGRVGLCAVAILIGAVITLLLATRTGGRKYR